MNIFQQDIDFKPLKSGSNIDFEEHDILYHSRHTVLYYVGFDPSFVHYKYFKGDNIQVIPVYERAASTWNLTAVHPTEDTAIVVNAKWSDTTGHSLLRALRTHPALKYLPVIVVSERMHLSESVKYITEYADDYYATHPEEQILMKRLDFLWRYKANIVQAREKLNPAPVAAQVKTPVLKRAVDIVLASFALIALSPLMLATALAIRIESKGPVIYKSRRIGSGYREFNFWKFRSMYADADQKLKEMLAANQYGEEATFVKFSNDPRITKTGRFIRKYSIDELPQLFNILMGDMSVVGNRPLPVYEAEQLFTKELDSCSRFLAPAGLTGLWQVEKRGQADMSAEERISLDVRYARHYNFITDVTILLKTFTAFIQKENV